MKISLNSNKINVSFKQMQQNQHISEKIVNLLATKGIYQKDFAPEVGYDYRHLNRKLSEKSAWNEKKVALASKALGVSTQYLMDESRPYYQGDKIPADAIIQPPSAQERQGDSDAITKLFILAEREMEYRTASNAKINPDAIIAAQEELAQEMRVLSTELRLLREEMARSREEDEGNHDADF